MSINISAFPPSYTQDTDNESWHFEHLEYLQDDDYDRGEEFEVELDLTPVTNYFGLDRAIIIADGSSPLSTLPADLLEAYWPLVTDLHARGEALEVAGRIWTSPEHKDFYASVRIDLPSIQEAEEAVRDDLHLDDDHEFQAPADFQNYIEDYTSAKWRQAHGMSDEQYHRRAALTALRNHQTSGFPVQDFHLPHLTEAERASIGAPAVPSPIAPSAPTDTPGQGGMARMAATQQYESTRKKGIIAWLLWLFLGALGAHRFYFGQTGYAVTMLLLGWATLGIWPLLDGLICNNRNLRRINTEKWTAAATQHGVPVQPLPESAT